MAATQAPLKICEAYVKQGGPLDVDEGAGVVKNCRVLGFSSSNRRRYAREGVEKAVRAGLYENVKVFVDHPNQNAHGPRASRDLFGKLKNARMGDDGVYADLHYLTKHPLAESVVEDCKRGLGLYGLSHNAEAKDWDFDNGIQVVRELGLISSVDLVSEPATNTNLWEGKAPMKTTLKKYLEGRTLDPQLPLSARGHILRLCEAEGEYMEDMPMDEPAPDTTPDGMGLLHQAVAALSAAGDEKSHALATKILKLLKPDADGDLEEDDDMGDDDKAKEGKQKAKPAGVGMLTEAGARDLCEATGIKATASLLESITDLPLDKALKVLRTVREASPATPGAPTRPPRTQESGRVTEAKRTAARLDKLPTSPAALRKLSRNLGNN